MRIITKLLPFVPLLLSAQGPGVGEWLSRLAVDPTNHDAILGLSGQYDGRVIDAFQRAFGDVKDPADKGVVAFTLVADGVADQKYFAYLAERASAAIDDDAPWMFAYDRNGKLQKGQVNPEFESWCKTHGVELSTCAKEHYYDASAPVLQIAQLGDPRATDLLMRGLNSANLSLVAICESGLGLLHHNEAVPTIAARLARVPADEATPMAFALAGFTSPEAKTLFERYVTDPELRSNIRQSADAAYRAVQQRRNDRGVK